MPRTLAQVDADLATLETWRSGTADPGLTQGRNAVIALQGRATTLENRADAIETFRDRVKAIWRLLITGRIEGIDDGDGALELQPRLTDGELRELRWLLAERSKVRR